VAKAAARSGSSPISVCGNTTPIFIVQPQCLLFDRLVLTISVNNTNGTVWSESPPILQQHHHYPRRFLRQKLQCAIVKP
jgi:hypothetical protein